MVRARSVLPVPVDAVVLGIDQVMQYPLVMIVDRHREQFLGPVLTYHVLIEEGLDLLRLGYLHFPLFRHHFFFFLRILSTIPYARASSAFIQ